MVIFSSGKDSVIRRCYAEGGPVMEHVPDTVHTNMKLMEIWTCLLMSKRSKNWLQRASQTSCGHFLRVFDFVATVRLKDLSAR
jgi:hypothetical protein